MCSQHVNIDCIFAVKTHSLETIFNVYFFGDFHIAYTEVYSFFRLFIFSFLSATLTNTNPNIMLIDVYVPYYFRP